MAPANDQLMLMMRRCRTLDGPCPQLYDAVIIVSLVWYGEDKSARHKRGSRSFAGCPRARIAQGDSETWAFPLRYPSIATPYL